MTATASNAKKSFYHNLIADICLKQRMGAHDPRHIEAFMRIQYGTLDHLPRSKFEEEVKLFHMGGASGGGDEWEECAKSFGL